MAGELVSTDKDALKKLWGLWSQECYAQVSADVAAGVMDDGVARVDVQVRKV